MRYPKITSEKQYKAYCEERIHLANQGTVFIRMYNKEINELNLRIIEWNCRHDDHQPVHLPDTTTEAIKSNLKEGPKFHLRKSKLKTQ